ncbi:flagellar basal body L-ring protein FlgH [Mesorhizobium sp. IMUNJ 23232]|uniref:flagellar basal body L-ring protein FlgH n=1 Tax=Mesorhizobium sp. IMUNJ 23232 TaxID=3376064 RepID=UPI00378840F1
MKRILAIAALGLLAGCGSNLKEIGKAPAMSPVGSGVALVPSSESGYAEPQSQPVKRFSLWNDKQSRLFTDPRAIATGDLLTVRISISDRAKFKNESDRSRVAERTMGLTFSGDWNGTTTGEASGRGAVGSTTSTDGKAATERSEDIDLRVAAVVTDVMPNGNLMIHGSQEVRVNYELRVLTIAGIVRPTDIGPENTISYDRIAEARISYGGRGRLSEVQQPGWGQQAADQLLPF